MTYNPGSEGQPPRFPRNSSTVCSLIPRALSLNTGQLQLHPPPSCWLAAKWSGWGASKFTHKESSGSRSCWYRQAWQGQTRPLLLKPIYTEGGEPVPGLSPRGQMDLTGHPFSRGFLCTGSATPSGLTHSSLG